VREIRTLGAMWRGLIFAPRANSQAKAVRFLFAINREAREQKLSLDGNHALRHEHIPALLEELHALLETMEGTLAAKIRNRQGCLISIPQGQPHADCAKTRGCTLKYKGNRRSALDFLRVNTHGFGRQSSSEPHEIRLSRSSDLASERLS
jgi:hypothetical protein